MSCRQDNTPSENGLGGLNPNCNMVLTNKDNCISFGNTSFIKLIWPQKDSYFFPAKYKREKGGVCLTIIFAKMFMPSACARKLIDYRGRRLGCGGRMGKSGGKIFSADPLQQFCRRSARIGTDPGRRTRGAFRIRRERLETVAGFRYVR